VATKAKCGLFSNTETVTPQQFSFRVWGSEMYPAECVHSALTAVFESMRQAQFCYVNSFSRGHLKSGVESQSRKRIMCDQPSLPDAA